MLLVKRSPQKKFYPDVWDLFGGYIEGSETPEEALCREAHEELLVEVESYCRLGKVHDPLEQAEITVFAISAWRGVPINAAPDEHAQINWFSADELPNSAGLDLYRELVLQAVAMNCAPP